MYSAALARSAQPFFREPRPVSASGESWWCDLAREMFVSGAPAAYGGLSGHYRFPCQALFAVRPAVVVRLGRNELPRPFSKLITDC